MSYYTNTNKDIERAYLQIQQEDEQAKYEKQKSKLMEPNSKYPKIQTLCKRDNNGKIIEGKYSMLEFETVRAWRVEEKIDGANIRIGYHNGEVTIKGRTDKADLKSMGVMPMLETVTEKLSHTLKKRGQENESLTFYGEAFGKNVQAKAGKLYSPDEIRFCLFDVCQYRKGWWDKTDLALLHEDLALDSSDGYKIWSPPCVLENVELQIADIVTTLKHYKPSSLISDLPQTIEGIIARPYDAMVYNNRGERVMFKLKLKDFS